jgi:hypothetical protein
MTLSNVALGITCVSAVAVLVVGPPWARRYVATVLLVHGTVGSVVVLAARHA